MGSGETTRVGDPSIAVPVPLPPPGSGHFAAPYRYPSEHLMPLNLAAKTPLSSDEDASPIISISKLPLNVPSYVPKFKGE